VAALSSPWAAALAAGADAGLTVRLPGPLPSSPPALPLRSTTGDQPDYAQEGVLGQGGAGIVLAARQRCLARTVALKRPRARHAREHFAREAVLVGGLDHPGVVPVYELAEDDDGLFYTMRLIDGDTWQAGLASQDPARRLDVLLRVAEAVAYIHAQGVVHLDIKPSNVLLGAYGEVLLTDWGLARRLGEADAPRGGTPAYLAPEQARDDQAAIGPATDVYLLGACLCQILCGLPPHPGDAPAAVAHALTGQVPDLPGRLGLIVRRCCDPDPGRRYADAGAVVAALRRHLAHLEADRLVEAARAHSDPATGLVLIDEARLGDATHPDLDSVESTVRLALAEQALAAGDHGLALRTLRPTVPAEAQRHAAVAALVAHERQSARRIRRLRRLLVAAAVVATVLAVAGWWVLVGG
jgi:serine/threonine protein kinase